MAAVSQDQAVLSETVDELPTESKTKRSKAPDTLTREPGKSIFPYTRVQKILKADKELVMVQREAAFLISRATEEFVQKLTEASQRVAERDRRTTVQVKDLVSSVQRAEELAFLEELIPVLAELKPPPTTRPGKSRAKAKAPQDRTQTALDRFVANQPGSEITGTSGDPIENMDGTLSFEPPAS
ncbi:histone-fold-containing protein [Epithele typhae]|uniref:histone-fold-containing protein n=1 Tax=Epithele typhae TaxID=378194 RepID=UPI0020086AC4|nr:histone-fold-containing protein [Epithele typhae]KAH9924681.1 histone-fold-containing protein [Epithele typhae]